jgi:hypothetical protein
MLPFHHNFGLVAFVGSVRAVLGADRTVYRGGRDAIIVGTEPTYPPPVFPLLLLPYLHSRADIPILRGSSYILLLLLHVHVLLPLHRQKTRPLGSDTVSQSKPRILFLHQLLSLFPSSAMRTTNFLAASRWMVSPYTLATRPTSI